jgi:hypothetical protein
MRIDVRCDVCAAAYRVPVRYAGRRGRCAVCGARISVPPATVVDCGLRSLTGGALIATDRVGLDALPGGLYGPADCTEFGAGPRGG